MHANVALEEFGAVRAQSPNVCDDWTADHAQNARVWRDLVDPPDAEKRPYCVCLNDLLGASDADDTRRELAFLQQQLCSLFPVPSSLERRDAPNPCGACLADGTCTGVAEGVGAEEDELAVPL
eukprot:TRINITY_DN1209_c0_g1_i5.p1 TRINITY_DN1209_c0_g1~~TRINITY_DN1209_c0_g1_i5.p1  ORF type:complete len:123 (-),score=42.54 TRINITY_DN1209_c0_g1_i5:45-413(-)